MKRATRVVVVFALLLTACGLKVPTQIVAGDGAQGDGGTGATTGSLVDPSTTTGGVDPGLTTTGGTTGGTAGAVDPNDPGSTGGSIFKSETEGVTKDTLTLCSHVPITGAAPIPHHFNRFGQFYFDYVNEELKGIYGRKIRFLAYDDGYYPAGARAAMEKCKRQGAFMYVGAAGTDQIVSVAKWAETNKVPYFHGPTSDKDLGEFNYNIHAGPSYEYQHRLLARYLVDRFGKNVDYAMIRVNSPYFDAGHDAFKKELASMGIPLVADKVVQKDQNDFKEVFLDLTTKGTKGSDEGAVEVVNNFTTPNIWLKMLRQKSPAYDPTWTAVSPVAGFNIVAQALSGSGNAVVFHHFSPACECTDFTKDVPSSLPWSDDIREFLRIFKKYSPEQNPPPDDFDYTSYLSAKAFHRILLKLGPAPTRTALFNMLKTYKEAPKGFIASQDGKQKVHVFPGCGADFTRGERRGSWHTNVFELKFGKWKQIETCIDKT